MNSLPNRLPLDGLTEQEFQSYCDKYGTSNYWNAMQWRRLVHQLYYKPDWKMRIEQSPYLSGLNLVLECLVMIPGAAATRLATTTQIPIEPGYDEKFALGVISRMIEKLEREISKHWLIDAGEAYWLLNEDGRVLK